MNSAFVRYEELMDIGKTGRLIVMEYDPLWDLEKQFFKVVEFMVNSGYEIVVTDILDELAIYSYQAEVKGLDYSIIKRIPVVKVGGHKDIGKVIGKVPLESYSMIKKKLAESFSSYFKNEGVVVNILLGIEKYLLLLETHEAVSMIHDMVLTSALNKNFVNLLLINKDVLAGINGGVRAMLEEAASMLLIPRKNRLKIIKSPDPALVGKHLLLKEERMAEITLEQFLNYLLPKETVIINFRSIDTPYELVRGILEWAKGYDVIITDTLDNLEIYKHFLDAKGYGDLLNRVNIIKIGGVSEKGNIIKRVNLSISLSGRDEYMKAISSVTHKNKKALNLVIGLEKAALLFDRRGVLNLLDHLEYVLLEKPESVFDIALVNLDIIEKGRIEVKGMANALATTICVVERENGNLYLKVLKCPKEELIGVRVITS